MAPTKKHAEEEILPREPDFEGLDTDLTDELHEEAMRAGQPFASATEFQPSSRLNPYVTEEMQGMEMTPRVIGPPPFGSPDPNTSSGRLVPIEDHPLAPENLPEGHGSAISADYGADLFERPNSEIEDAPQEDFQDDDYATGAARKLAHENGVDLDEVEGTGADDRITKGDVEKHIAENS